MEETWNDYSDFDLGKCKTLSRPAVAVEAPPGAAEADIFLENEELAEAGVSSLSRLRLPGPDSLSSLHLPIRGQY